MYWSFPITRGKAVSLFTKSWPRTGSGSLFGSPLPARILEIADQPFFFMSTKMTGSPPGLLVTHLVMQIPELSIAVRVCADLPGHFPAAVFVGQRPTARSLERPAERRRNRSTRVVGMTAASPR